jgi:DNA-binding NtrC family response regulator
MTERLKGTPPKILFVDDSMEFLEGIRFSLLANKDFEVVTLSDSRQALTYLSRDTYSAVFLDWIMPEPTGANLLPIIVETFPRLPVIIMTGLNDLDTAVNCMRQNAFDYITKPVDMNRLEMTINRAIEMNELSSQNKQMEEYLLGKPLINPDIFSDILTQNDKMQSIFKLIETISLSRYPVFIEGETGVGKELIAKAVHRASRVKGDLVALNIAAYDPQMIDDMLFGHQKGAFTGANGSREGFIAKAQGGTLFLDEIGDLSPECQIKLLRFLQEGEFHRLGSDAVHKSNARIIVASNKNFKDLMQKGKFREDLYHRLNNHKITVPPLRERREDILLLAKHYVAVAAKDVNKAAPRLSTELSHALINQDYPGNVRELINKVRSATVSNTSGVLTPEDFPDFKKFIASPIVQFKQFDSGQVSFYALFPSFPTIDEMEKLLVQEAMKKSGGKQNVTAELLGVCRQTVMKRMRELNLNPSYNA